MYKDLEYQLGGSSNSLDDLMKFINENKIIILIVIAVLCLLRSNTNEGFISYETIKKNLFFWDRETNNVINTSDENHEATI